MRTHRARQPKHRNTYVAIAGPGRAKKHCSNILPMSAILRGMLSISAATVLSRATGYLRWSVQAAVLGTGVVANAYAVSYILPGLIYEDRKSTRLNSSHANISYAVFCLKKNNSKDNRFV